MLDKSRFIIVSNDESTYDNVDDAVHSIEESIEDQYLDVYSVLEYVPISTKSCREFIGREEKLKAKESAISIIMSLPKELRDLAFQELKKSIEKDNKK
jgi:hypothetical protein